ncbi:MAG: hypothetical protein HWE26_17035 [Alteromonadaceae bacterium]|nr:hypothetical protein [Alteromonadaceae bacterium]
MDRITAKERTLIETHIAQVGVTRVKPGESGMTPAYIWDGRQLVSTNGQDDGWRNRKLHFAKARRARAIRQSETDQKIAEQIRTGKTGAQIAEALQVSRESIRRVAKANGLTVVRAPSVPVKPNGGAKMNSALTDRIRGLADGTRGAEEIARLVGCCPKTVRLRKERLKLDIP